MESSYARGTLHGPASSWRSRMLMLAMSVAGCQAFSSSSHCYPRRLRRCRQHPHDSWRHSPRRRPSRQSHSLSLQNNRERTDAQYDDSFPERSDSSPDWLSIQHHSIFAVAAATFVFVGVFSFTLVGDADAASILQHDKGRDISLSKNSLGVAVQSFFQKGTAPTTSRTMKLMQLPTLLSSDQSTTINKEKPIITKTIENVVKENPKATQQTIANPIASESKGSSSVKTKHPKSTVSTKKSSDVSSQKSKKEKLQATDVKKITSESKGSSAAKQTQPKSTIITEKSSDVSSQKGTLQASDVKKITEENKIDIELICRDDQRPLDASAPIIKIDRETFSKIKIYQPPFLQYLPSSVQPLISRQFQSMQVLESIPNNHLFLASVFAGSLTEIIRTSLLYPLSTVKARVQARTLSRKTSRKKRSLLRKLRVTWLTALYETKRGDWYAGILPTILIAVPASGVYSGMKEVSRRAFSMAIHFEVFQNMFPGDDVATSYYSALVVNLLAAFVADIASLVIRTPADVLAIRLQVFGNTNVRSDFGNWAKDSVALLPSMLLTDIPFLMSRIFLNAAITTGGENLGRYEFETIAIACLCAFLTTPFDVAKTRILLPTLPSEEEVEKSGLLPESQDKRTRRLVASSKYWEQRRQKTSVLRTMKSIAAEGDGGVQNLYAGWLERTAFLGLGRAWFDPLRVIGYLGIRDALLLKLFD